MMELYTLLSLCIGIFGGTYAALNACRTHFEYLVKEKCETATEQYKSMGNADLHKDARALCDVDFGNIKFWRNVWNYAHLAPALIFFVVMSFIALWAILEWNIVMRAHSTEELKTLHLSWPWSHFGLYFTFMCVGDLIAVAAAIISYWRCTNSCKSLARAIIMTKPKLSDPG